METIDITPSWQAVVPIIILALQSGTPEGQRMAREELERMARLADKHVEAEMQREGTAPYPEGDTRDTAELPER